MQRNTNRVAKNGRLTVSLNLGTVDKLNEIGEKMQQHLGLRLSYAQIVEIVINKYIKNDEE